jgi:hypothetical protein
LWTCQEIKLLPLVPASLALPLFPCGPLAVHVLHGPWVPGPQPMVLLLPRLSCLQAFFSGGVIVIRKKIMDMFPGAVDPCVRFTLPPRRPHHCRSRITSSRQEFLVNSRKRSSRTRASGPWVINVIIIIIIIIIWQSHV